MRKKETFYFAWNGKGSTSVLTQTVTFANVRAQFREIENASPTSNTFLTFSRTNILCPCMYTPGEC